MRRKGQRVSKGKIDRYAVMGIDPGGTTGVAAFYVTPKSTFKETIGTITNFKTAQVEGDYLEQGKQLASMMNSFQYRANVQEGIPFSNVRFAIEDFILRRAGEGGATGNLTSCWVAAAAVAIFGSEANIKWRQASEAKTYATDARLKMWDLWVPAEKHSRDAVRHACCEVNERAILA